MNSEMIIDSVAAIVALIPNDTPQLTAVPVSELHPASTSTLQRK